MYPSVVIVLVQAQCSMTDICEISPSNATKLRGPVASDARPATLGHFSFAVGSVHRTTDNEVESQRSRMLERQGGPEHGLEEVILEVKESQVGTSGSRHYSLSLTA